MSRAVKGFALFLLLFIAMMVLFSPPSPAWRLLLIPLGAFLVFNKKTFEHSLQTISAHAIWVKSMRVTLGVLVLFRSIQILMHFIRPIKFIEDIARVYQIAITGLFHGINPYLATLDPYCIPWNESVRCFSGLKYPPLQLFSYAPTVLLFGLKGIYAFHVPLYFGLAALIFFYLRKYSLFHAYLGSLLFLAADHVFTLAFNNGTNDLLPTFLLTYALIEVRKKKTSSSGVAIGLSLLAKQLPGGLLLVPLVLQNQIKILRSALIIFLLGCLPFLVWNSSAFLDNVFIFNLFRPARDSSFLVALPEVAQKMVQLFGVSSFIFLSFLGRRLKVFSLEHDFTLPVIGILTILLTAKMSPVHYFLWVTPVFILWLLEPRLSQEDVIG